MVEDILVKGEVGKFGSRRLMLCSVNMEQQSVNRTHHPNELLSNDFSVSKYVILLGTMAKYLWRIG